MIEPFPCDTCGACCRNVDQAYETRSLDRGDGTCQHYDDKTRLCRIYDNRPDICRVDLQYELNYQSLFTWKEFVELNVAACIVLKNKEGIER